MKKLLLFALVILMMISACVPVLSAAIASPIARTGGDPVETVDNTTEQTGQTDPAETDPTQPEDTQPPTEEPQEVTEPATQPATQPATEPAEVLVDPHITKGTPADGGVKLAWTSYKKAAKYRVFFKNGTSWKKIGDTAALSYTTVGLGDGGKYTFTVRAMDKKGKYISPYDKKGFTYTYYAPPKLKSVQSVNGGLKVSWEANKNVGNFRVYVKRSGSWTSIGKTAGTSFVDTDVESGSSYTYTVRCLNAKGSLISYFDKKGITGTYVAAPVLYKISSVEGGHKLKWAASAGAAKYRVFYGKDSKWTKLADVSTTSCSIKNLKADTLYTYTVRAMNAKSKYVSGYNTDGISAYYLAPPAVTSVTKTAAGPKITVTPHANTAGFRIYRKTYGGSWSSLYDLVGNAKTYTDKTAKDNTLYAYTLRYLDAEGDVISYYQKDVPFYYNGVLATGTYTVNGKTVNFKDGKLFLQGYIVDNGKTYYYSSNGNLLKNRIVGNRSKGYTYADANGVCCTSTEIKQACSFIINNATGTTNSEKLASSFNYLAHNYPYMRNTNYPKSGADIASQANLMFTQKKGNCYMYAAAFTYIAKALGYRVRFVSGTVGLLAGGTGPHGWTEVYVNGKWLACDPNAAMQDGNGFYMMQVHKWSPVAQKRYEIIIDSNGKVGWK